MSTSYVQLLNNYLQALPDKTEVATVSWIDDNSVRHVWDVTCKIRGVEKGRASAATKSEAREEAAKQALAALGALPSG